MKPTDSLLSKYAVLHDTKQMTFDEACEKAMEEYAAPYIAAVSMISKIARSKKHKDPLSDILCECNRAKRLATEHCEACGGPVNPGKILCEKCLPSKSV